MIYSKVYMPVILFHIHYTSSEPLPFRAGLLRMKKNIDGGEITSGCEGKMKLFMKFSLFLVGIL